MQRWRGLTVITGAIAACLVGIVLAREYRPDVLPADWRPKQQVVERVVEKPVEVVREVVREVPVGAAGAVRRGVPEGRAVAGLPDVGRYRQAYRHGAPGRGRAARRQDLSVVDRDRSRARRRNRSACSATTTSRCGRRSPPTSRRSSTTRPSGFRSSRSAARRPASRPARSIHAKLLQVTPPQKPVSLGAKKRAPKGRSEGGLRRSLPENGKLTELRFRRATVTARACRP